MCYVRDVLQLCLICSFFVIGGAPVVEVVEPNVCDVLLIDDHRIVCNPLYMRFHCENIPKEGERIDGLPSASHKLFYTFEEEGDGGSDVFMKKISGHVAPALKEISALIRFNGSVYVPSLYGWCVQKANKNITSVTWVTSYLPGDPLCPPSAADPWGVKRSACFLRGGPTLNAAVRKRALVLVGNAGGVVPSTARLARLAALELLEDLAGLFAELELRGAFLEDVSGSNILVHVSSSTNLSRPSRVYLADIDSLYFFNDRSRILGGFSCKIDTDCPAPSSNYFTNPLAVSMYSGCPDFRFCDRSTFRCRGFDLSLQVCGIGRWLFRPIVEQYVPDTNSVVDKEVRAYATRMTDSLSHLRPKMETVREIFGAALNTAGAELALSARPVPAFANRLLSGTPFVVKAPGHAPFIVCLVHKNGSVMWKLLFARILGIDGFPGTDGAFRINADKIPLPYHVSDEEWIELVQNASVPKYMVVRNPRSRLLSAYLDQVRHKKKRARFPSGITETSSFRELLRALVAVKDRKGLDSHFRLQSDQCGIREGMNYTFLPIERSEEWFDEFVRNSGIDPDHVNSGWGVASMLNSAGFDRFRDNVAAPSRRRQWYSTGAQSLLSQYYDDDEIEKRFVEFATRDIELFGYNRIRGRGTNDLSSPHKVTIDGTAALVIETSETALKFLGAVETQIRMALRDNERMLCFRVGKPAMLGNLLDPKPKDRTYKLRLFFDVRVVLALSVEKKKSCFLSPTLSSSSWALGNSPRSDSVLTYHCNRCDVSIARTDIRRRLPWRLMSVLMNATIDFEPSSSSRSIVERLRAIESHVGKAFGRPREIQQPSGSNSYFAFDGPEDPRAIVCANHTILVYNKYSFTEDSQRMYVFNMTSTIESKIDDVFGDMSLKRREKNWTPFSYHGELRMLYEPCVGSDQESVVLRQIRPNSGDFARVVLEESDRDVCTSGPVRGGTPLVEFFPDVFVGVGHTKRGTALNGSMYGDKIFSVPYIFNASSMSVVCLGPPINFDIEAFSILGFDADKTSDKRGVTASLKSAAPCNGNGIVQYPVGLVRGDDDRSLLLSMSVDDRCPFVLRIPSSRLRELLFRGRNCAAAVVEKNAGGAVGLGFAR